jgi:hypothetical protein
MATVLLTDDEDWCALHRHRCHWYHRLLARICGRRLDRRLESGADPDTGVLLSLRAAALIAPAHRRRLAMTLRQMANDAERSPQPFSPLAPLARRQILQARELIEEAALLLLCRAPANPVGVACVQVLLEDGASPLYRHTARATLAERLELAITALGEPPAITADA